MENENINTFVTNNDNSLDTNNSITTDNINETDTSSLADDPIAIAFDYTDRYYENVLSSLNTITTNQDTILENQSTLIEQNNNLNTLTSCILFVLAIVFIYDFVKKILKF